MIPLKKKLKLSGREVRMIWAAGGVLALILALQFAVIPAVNQGLFLERQIALKKKQVLETRLLEARYREMDRQALGAKMKLNKRPRGFTLFSFLDALAGKTGLKSAIVYMKPNRLEKKNSRYKISIVEMKMSGINMKQLVRYLYGVETSGNLIHIKKIAIIKTRKSKGAIDVVLQAETLEI
jgi:general secretion pathway protein M